MKIKRIVIHIIAFTITLYLISGCSMPGRRKDVPKIEMVVSNTLSIKRTDEFVVLKVPELKSMVPDFSKDAFIVIQSGSNQEIPHQLDDIDNDGEDDEIAMIMDMEPGEQKAIEIRYASDGRPVKLGYKKRTRATIQPEYEGLILESELIAYRLYLDQRDAISVFGKKDLGLSFEKSTSNEDYDEIKPWGDNILDGGNSLGCGGFGLWYENKLIRPSDGTRVYTRIAADGPIRSVAQVFYRNLPVGGQKINATATYTIYAGQKWMRAQIKGEGLNIPIKMATGLSKTAIPLIKDEKEGFFYTWRDLGMALIYPKESFDSFHEDNQSGSYLAVLNPDINKEFVYWSLATWNQGEIGIKDEKQFADMVESLALRLKNPMTVTIKPVKPRQDEKKQDNK